MLSQALTEKLLDIGLSAGDFAEVFCENTQKTVVEKDFDGLQSSTVGTQSGAGLRVFRGLYSAYVYTNNTTAQALLSLAQGLARVMNESPVPRPPLAPLGNAAGAPALLLPGGVAYREKMDVIDRALAAARAYGGEIAQAGVTYTDHDQTVQIANTEGLNVEDRRTKTRFVVRAHAQGPGGVQTGYSGPGAMQGFEYYQTLDVEGAARDAARMAVTMLHAQPCQGGRMPVVVEKGFGGLLFHEACGHSLESSAVARGMSEFSGKLGQAIASPLVTLVDDGTLPGAWGSLHVDDEGSPTRRNVLIENGVLKSYMVDRLDARRMGLAPTGNARRQSYRFAPAARMTNTFIAPGQSRPADLIANTEQGLYVAAINGGSVNAATGDFNFAALESYLIEDGKITRPVRGATLIGNGGQILRAVDMVASDVAMGQGFCFDASGALFIEAGQPAVRVSAMTVGGV